MRFLTLLFTFSFLVMTAGSLIFYAGLLKHDDTMLLGAVVILVGFFGLIMGALVSHDSKRIGSK